MTDQVRFSTHVNGKQPFCLIRLLEEDVNEEWGDAVEWIERETKGSKIYAFIESDDG